MATLQSNVKICRGVLMVRPKAFAFNEATAVTNAFQTSPDSIESSSSSTVAEEAIKEFNNMVDTLKQSHIYVTVVDGIGYPDEVFPNNWLVFLNRPKYAIFPMCAETRRGERDKLQDVLLEVNKDVSSSSSPNILYDNSQCIDFGVSNEALQKYMEGTGSIVFDHQNKIAYACLSPRTNEQVLNDFCSFIDYVPIVFSAYDPNDVLVYHTNVLMSIGPTFAIICADAIKDKHEKESILHSLSVAGKSLILLSFSQMSEFAGNMLILPVISEKGIKMDPLCSEDIIEHVCVCSSRAYQSLTDTQKTDIEHHARIVHCNLKTIETFGGGSARCMMAEYY